jgi:NADH-ubiquinone oxidoreductase chain 1
MLYLDNIISIIEVLIVTVPALLTVAFITIAERKTMASMQRRLGPNIVGYYGLLQPFADALKLLIKEFISPTQANPILFFLGPIITLIFALLGYAMIPYNPGISIYDFNLGILYILAVSSLATYGILLAGWSANSKYAFLGSLRSTAQLISYELIISSAILLVGLLSGSFNLSVIVESQRPIWYVIPLFPLFIIFFIAAVAETNRAPFDLAEAESELVSGFMTEHSAVIFVFFFLAEYASIILMCILLSIIFLGGYDPVSFFTLIYYIVIVISYLFQFIVIIIEDFINTIVYNEPNLLYLIKYTILLESKEEFMNRFVFEDNYLLESLLHSFILGIKSSILIFAFIWVRASYPRIRFDQLMSYCWTILLPVLIGFIVFIPCLMYSLDIIPITVSLL